MARRKVAGTYDWILPVGILGLGGWALWKFVLSPSSTGTGANNVQQAANVTAANQQAYQQAAAKQPQQLTDQQINSIIGNMLKDAESNTSMFSGSSYQEDIITQIAQVQNDTDLARLNQLWGTRNAAGASGSICDLIDIDCTAVDLGSFVHATLTPSQIIELNQLLSANGINYTFS